MHPDLPANSNSSPSFPTPWYRELNRYHWFVLIVCALGWLFDCMDQRIFLISRQAAVTNLLGYEQRPGDKLARIGETTVLAGTEETEARSAITTWSSWATAIFMIGWATGGLFFGVMGDRWGRARTMLLTILVYSVFTGLTALSQGLADFMIYRFITGMGVGGEFAAGVSLLAEVMPSRARPYALGMLQALSAVGNITGSLLSWGIPEWRYLFLVGIGPALMVVLVRRQLKEPESWERAREAASAARASTVASAPGATTGNLGEMLGDRRWRYHTIIGVLLALAGVIGLWGVGFWTFELVANVLAGLNYERSDINRIRAIGTALQDVGAFFGMFVFSLLAARMGRRFAFAVSYLAALGATILVFGTLSAEWQVYWMLPLLGFCNLAVFGGFAIYFPELYPTRLRSTGTGFCYNVARYLAAFGPLTLGYLVPLYAGILGPSTTDPTLPFRYATLTVACIYVLGLLTLPFAPETKDKPLPE